MKKLLATLILLMCVSVALAGAVDDSNNVIDSGDKRNSLCHDSRGNWNPQDKSCDPTGCGCLFHTIADMVGDIFG